MRHQQWVRQAGGGGPGREGQYTVLEEADAQPPAHDLVGRHGIATPVWLRGWRCTIHSGGGGTYPGVVINLEEEDFVSGAKEAPAMAADTLDRGRSADILQRGEEGQRMPAPGLWRYL